MEDHSAILSTVVIIIITAVLFISIFKKLKLSPILGYFLAGSILGEHGLCVVKSEQTEFFGEIGVAFLLFATGSALTISRLKAMKSFVLGLGSTQIIITALCITLATTFIGTNYIESIIIGISAAFSSTAIALQLIAEKEVARSKTRKLSLSILLMQDFAVIPIIIIIPVLCQDSTSVATSIAQASIKSLCTVFAIFIIGKAFLKPIYKQIHSLSPSTSSELFIATTLAIALGTSWLTSFMGLSLELGAFISGVVVAEAELHNQAEKSIKPFQSLLLGLFFMTIGMTIDIDILKENFIIVCASAIGIMAIKIIIIFFLCKAYKFSNMISFKTGLFLCQIGEFAFIVFRLAEEYNLITSDNYQLLLIIITTTMALTPIFTKISYRYFIKHH